MIKIEVDDRAVLAAFNRLLRDSADPRPALEDVGELMIERTRSRFVTSRGPDGQAWPANSFATIQRAIARKTGAFSKKTGKLTGTGAGAVMGKKPLIGESKRLSSEFSYRIIPGGLEFGSPLEYAAVQQFGAAKGKFGKTRRGAPIPWGTIPARPFLGISEEDSRDIVEIFNDHLRNTWRG